MARNSRKSNATAPATSPAAIAAEPLGNARTGRMARAARVRWAMLTSSMTADGFRDGSIGTLPTGSRNRPAWTIAVGKSRVRESERSSGAEDSPLALERLDLGGRVAEGVQHLTRVLAERRRRPPAGGRGGGNP